MRRGDVYMTAYTFPHERGVGASRHHAEKERPVLVLQNDADNDNPHYPLVMAAAITSQKTQRVYQQDVVLPAGEANLRQDSKVLLGLAQPFLKAALVRKVGALSPTKMREVDLKLSRLLALPQHSGS